MSSEHNPGQNQVAVPLQIHVSADSSSPEPLTTEFLNEDSALALLKQPDLSPEIIEKLSKNSGVMKSRKVKLALAGHLKTPRHISLPMVRHFFTFDLMQLALTPVVPADVKKAAEDALINRLEMISSGERLTLARRASGRVAGELLLDTETRVMQAAMENSRLTESPVIKAVLRWDASAALVQAVCHHAKWSLRREIRVALLRSQHTPMAKAVEFARGIPVPLLREVLQSSKLPANTKTYLSRDLAARKLAAQK
jgi:hypothetical protein